MTSYGSSVTHKPRIEEAYQQSNMLPFVSEILPTFSAVLKNVQISRISLKIDTPEENCLFVHVGVETAFILYTGLTDILKEFSWHFDNGRVVSFFAPP